MAARLTAKFATAFAVTPGDWTADEVALCESLAVEKYGAPAWNEKR